MHAISIVHDVLRKGCARMHATRLKSVLDATRAALGASSHTLSNLARALGGRSAVRHRVKRIDRLLGNRAFRAERASVYTAMARYWLRGNERPLIVVDWSDLNRSRSAQLIRASVALRGRSLTLYEEVHSLETATTPEIHTAFLRQLKAMLPAGAQPIVITDAGFRSPWFRAVEAQGWHWVGRFRNRDLVREHGVDGAPWCGCKLLYAKAGPRALDLGLFDCVRNHPHVRRLVLIKEATKGRVMRTVNGAKCRSNHSQKQAQAQREPWLLAASVSLAHLSAQAIVALYAQRMQIEQAFRDTKNARFGLGLSDSNSRTPERLAILAMIASLAEFVLRLVGQCGINQSMQYELQLTNRKTRPEISVIRVGQFLIDLEQSRFTAEEFRRTLREWAAEHWAVRA